MCDVGAAVKACYDVRESSAFWHKLALHSQLTDETDPDKSPEVPQWLSTHPNHESRAKKLDDMIPAVSFGNHFHLLIIKVTYGVFFCCYLCDCFKVF